MVIGMPDVQAIDFLDTGVIRLLVVQNPLAEVLPRFLRIAVVAPAIAASFLIELHGHIEVMRPDIFAQDKAAAVRKPDNSPYDIGLIRFCIDLLQNKKAQRNFDYQSKLCWAGKLMMLLWYVLHPPCVQQGKNDFLHLLGCIGRRKVLL